MRKMLLEFNPQALLTCQPPGAALGATENKGDDTFQWAEGVSTPGSTLGALVMLFLIIFPTTLGGRYLNFGFVDGETEAQRGLFVCFFD